MTPSRTRKIPLANNSEGMARLLQKAAILALMPFASLAASEPKTEPEWSIAGVAPSGDVMLIRIDSGAISREQNGRVVVSAYASLVQEQGTPMNVLMKQEIDCQRQMSRSLEMIIVSDDMSEIQKLDAPDWGTTEPSSLMARLIARACVPKEQDEDHNIIVTRRRNPYFLAEFVRYAYIGLLMDGMREFMDSEALPGTGKNQGKPRTDP